MQFTFKELRARKDLTQRELAKILGVSVATYNSWEKNPEKMPIKNVLCWLNIIQFLLMIFFLCQIT